MRVAGKNRGDVSKGFDSPMRSSRRDTKWQDDIQRSKPRFKQELPRAWDGTRSWRRRDAPCMTLTSHKSLSGLYDAELASKCTISRDNTADEHARRASLLRQFGQGNRPTRTGQLVLTESQPPTCRQSVLGVTEDRRYTLDKVKAIKDLTEEEKHDHILCSSDLLARAAISRANSPERAERNAKITSFLSSVRNEMNKRLDQMLLGQNIQLKWEKGLVKEVAKMYVITHEKEYSWLESRSQPGWQG